MRATMNRGMGYFSNVSRYDPIDQLKDWFGPNAAQIFNRSRSRNPDGTTADPRLQDAPAWLLGRFQSRSPYSELDTWFDAYAQPDAGKVFMKDLNTHIWYAHDLPQN